MISNKIREQLQNIIRGTCLERAMASKITGGMEVIDTFI
jgi:hypothetical protein